MLAKVTSGALIGIDAYPVEVEVDIAQGLPQFSTVGLPEGAVKESKDRVKSAIKNSGYDFPTRRITINLAPADIRKDGAAFDLPIAVGLLAATGAIRNIESKRYLILGELSLDGRVKPVKGVLPIAVGARTWELDGLIVPAENANEGALVDGDTIRPLVYHVGFNENRKTLRFNLPEEVAPDSSDALLFTVDVLALFTGKNTVDMVALPNAKFDRDDARLLAGNYGTMISLAPITDDAQ